LISSASSLAQLSIWYR